MAAWLSRPLQLHSSREFTCDGFTDEQCSYYMERWHFWYIADHVYALPTVAFFMCTIGIFIIGNLVSQVSVYRGRRASLLWLRTLASIRYLSYRGFRIPQLGWNSAPIGILILGAVGTIFFLCMDLIPSPYYWSSEDYGGSPPFGTRSGWMSLACMPFVFATAGKANWITLLTGVPHEKLQVFHRWIAYAFFFLALMHTFPFIVYHIRFHDMQMQFEMNLVFYWTGIVALTAQTWLTFASFGPIRKLGYEFFKATHFLGVAVFVVIFFFHCDHTLTSWDYFIATAFVYGPTFAYTWLRTIFEYGTRQKAEITIEDNGFTRVTIPANFKWVPGQHCFLRFTGFGVQALASSHPFTICCLPSDCPAKQSEMVFYLRHRGGFTKMLHEHALQNPGVPVGVLVDGPYGGIDVPKYYTNNRVIVIVGGSGAGWSLPLIEQFARSNSAPADQDDGHRRPLSLRVLLATRDTSTRVWFTLAVKELLFKFSTLDRGLDVNVQVFLTGEAEKRADSPEALALMEESGTTRSSSGQIVVEKDGSHNSSTGHQSSQELAGRPQLPMIVHEEAVHAAEARESLGIFVCGPDTMQNDVRNAVAQENLDILKGSGAGGVYLYSEHFSWA